MLIILLPPLLDNNLCLRSIGEQPPIQTFSAKYPVEALDERVLPRTAGRDIQRVAVPILQPLLKGVGNEFRAIVAAQIVRRTTQQE